MADSSTGVAELLGGGAVAADHADWDAARQAFNLAVDQVPEAVVFPSDAEDVARVIRIAREQGLKVAAQRTGHGAEALCGLEGLSGTVLVNTREMASVELDADARRARVEAGARWMDLVPQASELGLAALHGSAPDICITGYTLGGGLGFYGRKLGLAANHVTAIELVNADGEQVRTDAETEPELFWACRGGGGNFGIVTALEFDLFPLEQVYAGAMFFEFERAAEVLNTWRELLAGSPDELTTVGRLMQFPPLPEVPEPLRGNSFALVEAIFMGDEAEGAELLKPLRGLKPSIDMVGTMPPAGISELHMDPPEPVPYGTGHRLLNGADEKMIEAIVAAGGPGSGSHLLSVELRQLGGAFARSADGAGALDSIDADLAYFAVGMKDSPESGAATAASLAKVDEAVAPYDAGRSYYNFVEQPSDPSACWDAETYARLQKARTTYDPDGLFRANHTLTPAA